MFWKNAIIYQIYPRSFKDSNGDGIGDINGIISKLDYLNNGTPKESKHPTGQAKRSLGVDAIWICPMYTSPMKDYGYDIADYYDIDPIFGQMDDFDKLVDEAHKRNIKVIMDFVPNHTSDEHKWFKQSRSSRDNPKRDFYIWRDPKPGARLSGGESPPSRGRSPLRRGEDPPSRGRSPLRRGEGPPNNWISVFGGSAWTFDKKTNQYYLHSFLSGQPDLNFRNPEVVDHMRKVLRFWLDRGVDGFRVDAFNHLFKHEEFHDEPQNPIAASFAHSYNSLIHIYTQGQPELISTVNDFCNILHTYGDRFMILEMYIGLDNLIKFHNACSHNFHAPSNFALLGMPWKASTVRNFIDIYDNALLRDGVPNYVLGNHDIKRVATRIGKGQARIAAMLLLTLRGMSFIYYGEELGMENTHIPEGNICDPCGKKDPLFGRDPMRTPMQWNSAAYAGFSTHESWLPVNHNFTEYNVESELLNPRSMLNLYRRLIFLKKQLPALMYGTYTSLDINSRHIFAYTRTHKDQKILVVLNFSHKEHVVKLDIDENKTRVICNTHMDKEKDEVIQLNNFVVREDEGYVLELST